MIAHDLSAAGVRAALAAGVDGLAHGALVDSAIAKDMKNRGMFMMPTLASLTGATPGAAEAALVRSVKIAYDLGVPIVFGTDAGVLPHGSNAQEFSSLVKAGVSPLDAIRAATVRAAQAFGLKMVGIVAPGAQADIIAVEGDPLLDLGALSRVKFVVRAGRVIRNDRN